MKHRASVSPSKMKEGERNMIKGSENKHKDPKVNTESYISDPAVPACFMRFASEPKRLEIGTIIFLLFSTHWLV